MIWNGRLSTSAGRFRPGSRNPLFPRPAEIEIASYLRDIPDGPAHIRATVLHEMVHYHLWHLKRPYGHTPEFNEILKQVGGTRYNTVPKERKPRHYYRCIGCLKVIPTQRLLKSSACAECCRKYNNNRFTSFYKLERMDEERVAAMMKKAYQQSISAEKPPPPAEKEEPAMPVNEIIRRLEELKEMVGKKKPL